MHVAVYRWRIHPQKEEQGGRTWPSSSKRITQVYGSHGSRKHRDFEACDDSHYGRAAAVGSATVIIASPIAREQDVLAGLAHGLPNNTTAYDMQISPRTVEVHGANLMTNLGVQIPSGAMRIAAAARLGQSAAAAS